MHHPNHIMIMMFAALSVLLAGAPASAQTIWYVDDNAPGDPGPGDTSVSDPLENGTPDHPFDAIQEAVSAAVSGDTVLVLEGTYSGVGNRDVNFGGRLITVRSESGPETCVIDLAGATGSHGFVFQHGETADAVVDGFTISGGWTMSGTGVRVESSAPSIARCVFSGNYGFWGAGGVLVSAPDSPPTLLTQCRFVENSGSGSCRGGGLQVEFGSAVLVDCSFIRNSARQGGGLYALYGAVALTHCEFIQNTAALQGGAICLAQCGGTSATVTNCAFIENVAGDAGGGVAVWDRAGGGILNTEVYNSTFAGNEASTGRSLAANTAYVEYYAYNSILWEIDPVYCSGGAGFHHYYSDVRGYSSGGGNIDADPGYVDPSSGDYRLGSGSPCIDAADTTTLPRDTYDLDGDGDISEPIPVDLGWLPRNLDDPNTIDTGMGFPCVDMGAYEFQPEVSGVEAASDWGSPARIRGAVPNPARTHMTVTYSAAAGEVVTLDVFDVFGRRVATLTDVAGPPGSTRSSTWNGRDRDGVPVASGVYLIRLRTSHGTDGRSIVVVR